ncbi:hypothetical protein [Actinoallomurus sp. CA-150999]|uniref:hypothetical protein n=1 Tax=Actinoallomurus sp. CA-150999 TaxID=3239887 RepID=UPI003D9285AD
MDTTRLTHAYRDLVAAASAIDAAVRRADVDWTLAHIALSDEMLAGAAERLLTGENVVVDNRAAMDETAIAELIAATSHAERVALVHRNGAALTNVVGRIPEATADRTVRIRLVDRTGRQVTDAEVTWDRLIRMRAEEHLPGHTARLAAVSGAASATRP